MLNGEVEYPCAILRGPKGVNVITVNKSIQKRLSIGVGNAVRVRLREDTTPYGLPMPEELRVLLDQDPEGDKLFHALTPGRLRTLLYIIGKVRDPEKRIARAVVVVRHLKVNNGKIDYRRLITALREQGGNIAF